MSLDVTAARKRLQEFDFRDLFREELGWSRPRGPVETFEVQGEVFRREPLAELGGVVVFEVQPVAGSGVPPAPIRAAVLREVSRLQHENLLLFVDRAGGSSVWAWGKRDGGRLSPREHSFLRGQSGDLFLSKLAALVVEIAELDENGRLPVTHAARKLAQALDVERVTKRFFDEYAAEHEALVGAIVGVPSERDRHWYASVLLHRLMFITFLQKKGFLDRGDFDYLRQRLAASRKQEPDRFYRGFLNTLFFEGFAQPVERRSAATREQLGDIRYLNGGLFLPHRIELDHPELDVPDAAFATLFDLFERYSWHLDDTPGGADHEINPDVLGTIFEKYINQKAFGAYYTRPEITSYLCEETIHALVLDRLRELDAEAERFDKLEELLLRLDARWARLLLLEVLPKLSILDPACGSGAFLVAAQKTLLNVYSAVLGFAKLSTDTSLRQWLETAERDHPSLSYHLKKRIVTQNLFGVDVMEEAVEIARLRLFLALVASAATVEELEPLPNIDFNLLAGNSLVGLLHVDAGEFSAHQQADLFRPTLPQMLADKNRLVEAYRGATTYGEDLRALRDEIETKLGDARSVLHDVLLGRFAALKIQVEEATWDTTKGEEGKSLKRKVTLADIAALAPFHWGYEFDQVLDKRGGFDVILTNPPWETWKPQAKEFFAEHSELVFKNKTRIEDFEKEKAKLLADETLRAAWLEYQTRFPHVSQWFRKSPDFAHQSAEAGGKKTSSDLNLYKLFLERAFRLLRQGGRCGILIPTGFYSDLGAKGLRELVFGETEINHLFGLSNERYLFDGVHHSFRICLLTFRKGGSTERIRAAFRINPREAVAIEGLTAFLHDRDQHLEIPLELVKRLSPDSVSLLEFKSEADVRIAEKMLRFPLLGELIEGSWNLRLAREFDMSNDSGLFRLTEGPSHLPLVEGKMIHQFEANRAAPRYWLPEGDARRKLLGRQEDSGQLLTYQAYRIAHRRIARASDQRTMIAAVLPPGRLCADTAQTTKLSLPSDVTLLAVALLNSFVFDFLLRTRVGAHADMHFVYAVSCPRLDPKSGEGTRLVNLAARLTCTTPDFADLWVDALGTPWTPADGATDPTERARLRAELDARIAHLYGLDEAELRHVLATFPVVDEGVKAGVVEWFGRVGELASSLEGNRGRRRHSRRGYPDYLQS